MANSITNKLSHVKIESFINHVDKYDINRKASIFNDLKFFDEFTNTYPQQIYETLNKNVDRVSIVNNFTDLTKNMELSNKIEAGIYEYALSYVFKNDMDYDYLTSIYNDKTNELLANFDKKSSVKNKSILNRIKNNELNPQELAFLKPLEIHPMNWKHEIDKKEKIEYKKNHMAATDVYKCYECGERKCIIYQMQTRSIDEPCTNFASCLICYNTFRVT
jgi:DNA-directed RNA polymerase subunit M/transcription elongation factor TFIIS